jgi:hypothetical protein
VKEFAIPVRITLSDIISQAIEQHRNAGYKEARTHFHMVGARTPDAALTHTSHTRRKSC